MPADRPDRRPPPEVHDPGAGHGVTARGRTAPRPRAPVGEPTPVSVTDVPSRRRWPRARRRAGRQSRPATSRRPPRVHGRAAARHRPRGPTTPSASRPGASVVAERQASAAHRDDTAAPARRGTPHTIPTRSTRVRHVRARGTPRCSTRTRARRRGAPTRCRYELPSRWRRNSASMKASRSPSRTASTLPVS